MSPQAPSPEEPEAAPSAREMQSAVQQDMMRLEVFREQLGELVREQELLRVTLESHARAQKTLEAMETFQGDQEILVPVGAETYLHAVPSSTEKVLIGIGRGIVAELERPKALEVLAQRRGQLEKSEQSLNQQLRRVESEANQLQARLQAVYAEAQRVSEEAGGIGPPGSSTPGGPAGGPRDAAGSPARSAPRTS